MTLGQQVLVVFIGALPSLIWLYFFLKEDCHPEPKSMLAKVFLMGIIVSPLAIIFQIALSCSIQLWQAGTWCLTTGGIQSAITNSPSFFLGAAFIEELIKFLAVRFVVLNSPEFDEPTDGMIYMITAALGFATMENILVVFKIFNGPLAALATSPFRIAANTLTLRFFGATLLHALSSGLLGYFLANAWLFDHHKKKLIAIGLAIATLFHFTFNLFLSGFEKKGLGLATILLTFMAVLIYLLFLKVRDRYCKTKTNNA